MMTHSSGARFGYSRTLFILINLRIRTVYDSMETSTKLVVKGGRLMLNDETMRINNSGRATTIWFFFDGQPASARVGESVAAALFASGTKTLRASPRERSPRGMFCLRSEEHT